MAGTHCVKVNAMQLYRTILDDNRTGVNALKKSFNYYDLITDNLDNQRKKLMPSIIYVFYK